MMNDVLRNTWYVAAWCEELVTGKLLARRLLDEPVALWRDATGKAIALTDRCPHRFAPLSMGRLTDDGTTVECPYHGLRFGAHGRCTLNPHGDGAIPKAAMVRSYPVVERYSMVWIWMGDAQAADPSLIPVFEFNDPQHWAVGTGHMVVEGHYELETDNILDLSHIEFLHPMFSSEAVHRAKVECEQDGDTVWCKRFMSNDVNPPAFLRDGFRIPEGPIDRWLHVRWNAPSNMALYAGGCAAGNDPATGIVSHQAHCFTPENATRTHYFYSTALPRTIGPMADTLAREQVKAITKPFELEDNPMIEAVQKSMGGADLWSLKPVLLPGDAAGIRARRILQARITAEQQINSRT